MPTQKMPIACIQMVKAKAEKTAMTAGVVGMIAFLTGLYFHAFQGALPIYSSFLGGAVALIAVAYGYGIITSMESLPPDSEIILELLTDQEEKPKA